MKSKRISNTVSRSPIVPVFFDLRQPDSMKKLYVLFLATAALAVAISVLVPTSPTVSEPETVNDPVTAETTIGESEPNDEYVQIGLDAGLSLEAAEEIARYVESPGEISAAEFMERIVGIAEDNLRSNPATLPNAVELRLRETAMEVGDRMYEEKWSEFVSGLGLQDPGIVRRVITDWEARGREINDLFRAGEMDREEYVVARPSMEDLLEGLRPHLTAGQLAEIEANHEAWLEYGAQQRAAALQYYQEAGYRSGVYGAVNLGDLDLARERIRAGEDVNAATLDNRWSPLLLAAYNGDVEMARLLIDSGANTNWTAADGSSALTDAALNGHDGMVRLLLEAGADIDYEHPGIAGQTALVHAAQQNHTHVVETLLGEGASVDGMTGELALSWARDYGNSEMERMLRDAGAGGLLERMLR